MGDFNLARDALASGSVWGRVTAACRRTTAIACVMFAMVIVGLMWQRHVLTSELGDIRAWEQEVFADVFPDQPVPPGVALRLASERRRWSQLTQAPAEAPRRSSDILACLRDLTTSVPHEMRIDVQELRIGPRDVMIRASARDHRDAESLASSLDKSGSLRCEPPRTQRLPDGTIQFDLHAARVEPVDESTPENVRTASREKNPRGTP